ncbi:MAG: 50S ribosomal protein L17 [Desulfobacteraceae bacterium]|nr:50S ribosomal protein L17 [Desulfobacteraceae bacterium]MBU4056173.1 50S ribosomal protein L17 [Pseudomonadota bacterium]
MRHRKSGVKLNRTSSHRNAMFRNMVTSLFKYEKIQTTDTKAKELRKWADNIITLAKRGDLHARRQVLSIIREKDVVHKLFENANEKYGERAGGYTRIVKVGRRPGDAAPVSLIEIISKDTAEAKTKSKKGTKSDKSLVEKSSQKVSKETVETKIDAEGKKEALVEAPVVTAAESKEAVTSDVESETEVAGDNKSPEKDV